MNDTIRCSLDDSSGVLAFRTFEVVEDPGLEPVAELIREYLVGRPLAEVDEEELRGLVGAECQIDPVLEVIRDCRRLCGPNHRPRGHRPE